MMQVLNEMMSRYGQLPEACLQKLLKVAEVKSLESGTQLVAEGAYATSVYYIIQGAARAYYLKDGRDVSDWFAFENEFICSIQSYFTGVPSPHYIEVLEPSMVLEIKKETISQLADEYRAMDRLEKEVVTQTLLKLQERLVSLQFESAQQKYKNLLAFQSDIELRVPLTHIASYLGITLETLSRIRHANVRT